MPAPTGKDLSDMLSELEIAPPSMSRLNTLVGNATGQFEKRTGWSPFVSDGSSETRLFDPPGGIWSGSYRGGGNVLRLDKGLLSCTAVTVSGSPKYVGVDYFLRSLRPDGPAEVLEFAFQVYGLPLSISVAGVWGFVSLTDGMPGDALYAILCMAAIDALREFVVFQTGGASGYKEADAEEQYGERPGQSIIEGWKLNAEAVINSYRRGTTWL